MSIAHLLEDFASSASDDDVLHMMSDVDLEEHRLEAFEKGYTAGWDDAISAKSKEGVQLTADLVEGIEKLNFSYHDALQQLLEKVEPVFEILTDTILPEALAAALGPQIVEELASMARARADVPLILSVPPGSVDAIRTVLDANGYEDLSLTEDDTLSPGQASLRLGETGREIDGSGVLDAIRAAVDAFIYQTKEDIRHG
ncbi:FliH/SctL family protein [Chachezhania sediminis]|uniref:ABC transporter ATP-binding protein n=1 Tax=Chachezhania sediminis TaxID=2599291 RepID=UPI00131A86D7|nr:ABC transporter ATP-binding protein [Chachezhania sediminis]